MNKFLLTLQIPVLIFIYYNMKKIRVITILDLIRILDIIYQILSELGHQKDVKKFLIVHIHLSESCIERTFGVWKKRWKILHDMPSFSFEVQRDIVVTSMAIHNYIRRKSLDDPAFAKFDEHPEVVPPDIFTDVEGFQQDGYRGKGNAREMDSLRDRIASSLELTRRY